MSPRTKCTSKRTPAPTNRSSSCSLATAPDPSCTTLPPVAQTRSHLRTRPETIDQHPLHNLEHDDRHHRRQIDHPKPRHDATDRIEDWLRDRVQRLHQRAPRIHVEPAQDRPHENRDDQQREHQADDLRDRRIACRATESEHYAPSSRDRSYAASIASMIAPRTPAFSSAIRPAAVVPAGDVTSFRSAAGCFPVASAYFAEPMNVCSASISAASRLKPMCTPASTNASSSRYTKPGPLPDNAVAMSR